MQDNTTPSNQGFFKKYIDTIYKSDFFEANLHGWITALSEQGVPINEAIDRYRARWNLNEDTCPTDVCRMIYYRKSEAFRQRDKIAIEISLFQINSAEQLKEEIRLLKIELLKEIRRSNG